MLEGERGHRSAVIGTGKESVVVFELQVIFINFTFLPTSEDGHDMWIGSEGEERKEIMDKSKPGIVAKR